jgi:FkbM family methyltransferase
MFKKNNIPFYSYIKYSKLTRKLYESYLHYFDDQYKLKNRFKIIGGKLICTNILKKGSDAIVFSAGVGIDLEFEQEIIDRYGIKCFSVDPTDTAESYYKQWKRYNKKSSEKLSFEKIALTADGAQVHFYHNDNDYMASIIKKHRNINDNNQNESIWPAISLGEILEKNEIQYLKLDIEGAEYEIIKKISNLNIPQVNIEFHHFCANEYNLQDTINCVYKMEGLGYEVIDYGSFHGRGRGLPKYSAKWSDNNVEFLFIKKHLFK